MKIEKLLIVSGFIFLAGCSQSTNQISSTGEVIRYQKELRITSSAGSNEQLYATVVAENTTNISSSIAGSVEQFFCQPGMTVAPGTVIARVVPDPDDQSTSNSMIQRDSLQGQLVNFAKIGEATTLSFDVQRDILLKQQESNKTQLDLLKKSLANSTQQKELTSGDTALQLASLQDQLATLELAQKTDLDKVSKSVENSRKTLYNTVYDGMRTIDDTFGITAAGRLRNSTFDIYVSFNDGPLGLKVERLYDGYWGDLGRIVSGMSNDEVSQYAADLSTYFTDAATAISKSATSYNFTQATIDSLYASLRAASNSLLATKTSFDSVAASAEALTNSYKNQISTLKISIQNLSTNKSQSATLSLDTNINTLKSQISNLELGQANVEQQLKNLDNTKTIQLSQILNQTLSTRQSAEVLRNNLNGETLRSPVAGVIKARLVSQGNKVAASALLCQISPSDVTNLKLQISSPVKLSQGASFVILKNDEIIGSGKVAYELPITDAVTQSFLYEAKLSGSGSGVLKEGERVEIAVMMSVGAQEIWLPLQFVTPKIEGYFVLVKRGGTVIEKQVTVGLIDNEQIQILSGLQLLDVVVY
ncbi:MAG TPA: hypothetical protein PKC14_02400 [Candidatus Absconditabacterales bacterium]|nr:hypothetical protein [Candidatus Absconditabacterales bacterium]